MSDLIFLQLIILTALLGLLLRVPAVRAWIQKCQHKDIVFGSLILGVLILGHALDFSRATFPLVNWSMYTEVNNQQEFQVVDVICESEEGQKLSINPIQLYPSLCHCFPARFTALVKAADEGKLTENDTLIYNRLIQSIGSEFAKRNRLKLKSTRVELIHIDAVKGSTLERTLVSIHDARSPSKFSVASRPTHPEVE